jgi:NADH-quinone oxidoreductase subunit J
MTVVFGIAAVLAFLGAVGVVLSRRTLYSALSLVLNMVALAVLFLLLDAQFLAAVQIIVYAGAVMVLFVFIIALLAPGAEERIPPWSCGCFSAGWRRSPSPWWWDGSPSTG